MKGLIEQIYPLVKNLGNDEVEALLMRLAKNIESLQAENERLQKVVDGEYRNLLKAADAWQDTMFGPCRASIAEVCSVEYNLCEQVANIKFPGGWVPTDGSISGQVMTGKKDPDHEPENPMCACPSCINEGWAQQSIAELDK